MSSVALQEWQGTRSVQLDELDAVHGAVGDTGPDRSTSWRTLLTASQHAGSGRSSDG